MESLVYGMLFLRLHLSMDQFTKTPHSSTQAHVEALVNNKPLVRWWPMHPAALIWVSNVIFNTKELIR